MSQHPTTYVPKSAFGKWFESRLPIAGLIHSSFIAFPVPRNLTYFWTFGAILVFMLVDRKSTRLNSSHANISYAVFCLKKKNRILTVITEYISYNTSINVQLLYERLSIFNITNEILDLSELVIA